MCVYVYTKKTYGFGENKWFLVIIKSKLTHLQRLSGDYENTWYICARLPRTPKGYRSGSEENATLQQLTQRSKRVGERARTKH